MVTSATIMNIISSKYLDNLREFSICGCEYISSEAVIEFLNSKIAFGLKKLDLRLDKIFFIFYLHILNIF